MHQNLYIQLRLCVSKIISSH